MSQRTLRPLLLAILAASSTSHAAIDLVAVGTVDGRYQDHAMQTAGALESGVPGNILGGTGSGFAYAGGTSFIALPDRGPNATSYNSAVDHTTSYIPRMQEFSMSLAPSIAGSSLPLTLTPMLMDTTLFSSYTSLYYAAGSEPAINTATTKYFSARSDNFDPTKSSLNPDNARLDPEGIRVSRDGKSVFITDEYGPYIYRFDRKTGKRNGVYTLPAKFAVSSLNAVGNTEISGNSTGRVANRGMEALAITPLGGRLVGMMQSPLLQDGGADALYARIVNINVETGITREFAYPLTNVGTVAKPKASTVSEILAINENEFLVLERDGKGRGDGSAAVFKKLYKINLNGAQRVDNITGTANLAPLAVTKTLVLDVVTALASHGYASTDVPAKLEGMAFGPDVTINGNTQHTLWLANDNDFLPTDGALENPNNFFVFSFDSADIPGFVAQSTEAIAPYCSIR